MIRIALVVGVNYYLHQTSLRGCVDDAETVKRLLERHGDGSVNFDCELLASTGPHQLVSRQLLKDKVAQLFAVPAEIALFYFAGHGHIEVTGGYVLGSDARRGDDGFSLLEVLTLANTSPAANKVIVLDACHSGIAGSPPGGGQMATLAEGLTVLTASTSAQAATEQNGRGIFTTLFEDALSGSAANLTGDITPGSIYAHIDQSLGGWEQRPVFKTNVQRFVSLRKVPPPISLQELRRLVEFFPKAGCEFQLDPTYEDEIRGRLPGMPDPIPEHTRTFAVLQRYNRLNLLVPSGAPHLWHAAMESKSCRLTVLGEHYRSLVARNRL